MTEPAQASPFEAPARLFKTLMHPARLAILAALRQGEQCVCHLEAHLGYRQAYISQQLMVLRDAGLVEDRRDGLNIYYHVSQPGVYPLIDASWEMLDQPNPTSGEGPGTTELPACPCPKCNPDSEAKSC